LGGFFVSVFREWMKTWFDLSIKNAKAPNEVEEILSGSQIKKLPFWEAFLFKYFGNG